MKKSWSLIAGFLLVLALILLLRNQQGEGRNGGLTPQAKDTDQEETISSTERRSSSSTNVSPGDYMQAIENAHAALIDNSAGAQKILDALRYVLFQGDQEASARAVSDFLRSNRDAPTGTDFSVGADGVLSAAPTLRTALLNWHPTLDPLVALEMAREILKTTDSPDEYAVALRNLAWNDLNGDLKPELSTAFRELLERREWREEPTAGYLEAFDVAVALGDTHTFQRLADLVAQEGNDSSLVRAASMSMDRMILREPMHLTNVWNSNPQWMAQAPMQRASLLSRLDITREDHRAVILDYLSSDRIAAEEREYFEALYPNGNHLYGHRLVTTNEKTPTIDERVKTDREILRQIDELKKQAPARAVESLDSISQRLAKFVKK